MAERTAFVEIEVIDDKELNVSWEGSEAVVACAMTNALARHLYDTAVGELSKERIIDAVVGSMNTILDRIFEENK